ncbi:HD domain-containing protein [Candidatus Dojkabacteria bacterium]|uniref:CCA-adding enzyme n=2 Tax=Candidatus Dojkabacteria TaxID=74243 RepID=A0A136KJP2_9BACT|nr:MAG: CCA-adding enzyme [candidate division WS6 bacterium OLB21]MBW7953249.1 HD domain-containing protein [Candidatus Dojkabacteria bacterium]
MINHSQLRNQIPEYVFRVADILIDAGYEAHLVGGAVRDLLLSRSPKDFDLATNAKPEDVQKLFVKAITTNAAFGTVLIVIEDENGERKDVEVTTYRKEENYIGGRWPSHVEFSSAIEEDLARRDFTINAIAINFADFSDPGVSIEEIIVDPYKGVNDLLNKTIRAVRDPLERFGEDGLRAFKACRLASELDFEIEIDTFNAIQETLHVAKRISMERVREELNKLLMFSPKPSKGIELLRMSGLLELFIPELLELIGLVQPKWHADDVYTHSLKTLDLAEDSIKLAALLHDIGKSRTKSEDETGIHFFGHDVEGSKMATEILSRLRYSSKVVKRVASLVRWHMFYYPSAEYRKSESQDAAYEGGWSDAAVRRFIKNVGDELIDDLFKLRIADATANPHSQFDPNEITALQARIAEIRRQELAIKLSDLAINGRDLIGLGITSGPMIGKILNDLLEIVVEEPLSNKKEELLRIATDMYRDAQGE